MSKATAALLVLLIMLSIFTAHLYIEHSQLLDNYINLSKDYAQLQETHSRLEENYTQLSQKYTKLKEDYTSLTSKYKKSLTTINKLSKEINKLKQWLKGNTTMLVKYKLWLEGNITVYEQRITEYKEEINKYKQIIAEYERNITALQEKTDTLTQKIQDLQSYLEILEHYVEGINTRLYLTSMDQEEIDSFLNQSIRSVKKFTEDTFGSAEGTELFRQVFKWVLKNLYYEHDPYVPSMNYYKVFNNFWKLANETIATNGGDCEDLALLIYSILINKGYEAYLLGWYSTSAGHMAVLAKYGDKWIIIDPAGNWINGYSIYLAITIYRNGWIITYYLSPLHIAPDQKQAISSVTKTVWYDQEDQAIASNINLERYASLKKLVEKWTQYWAGLGAVIDKYELISVGVSEEFNTIDELVSFLENK